MTGHSPWCIAHRGARDEAPENTLSAFHRALAYPVDGIEFDVQMSCDGGLILFHDRTVYKVGGGRRRVADMTIDALARIDWGKWFHPDFTGEPLMTFDMALSLLDRCPRLFIEIKSHPDEQASGHAYRLTERLVEAIERPEIKRFHQRIAILSFDPKVLAAAYERAPHLHYVLNLPINDPDIDAQETDHLWAVGIKISKLSEHLVQKARLHNLRVFTYTCNGPRQVAKARRLGVDAIISDRPRWLIDRVR
jgi:glycerophosphoryl diester phosphodiesterase